MISDEEKERLARLDARIKAAKSAAEGTGPRGDEHYSTANQAWRMVTELVAGLGLGVAIGYGLDQFFGTIPIFLIAFTLLGFIAGVKTMLRTAQEIQTQKLAEMAEEERAKDER